MTTKNTYSTHDPAAPIVLLDNDPISLIEQVCDLILESFADLAARLGRGRGSEGVSQNDSSIPPAPFPPTPDTATG